MFHGRLTPDLARGLRVLRDRIELAQIPPSILDETLNLATWNIREFGRRRRRSRRSAAAIHFVAEILSQFDLIAITEVRDDLTDLNRVMTVLGPYWRVVFSDFNADRAGNRERIAYLFDKRAVVFTGLAAEADPPRRKVRGSIGRRWSGGAARSWPRSARGTSTSSYSPCTSVGGVAHKIGFGR